ncbi:MAG: hypothetical protein GTN97_06830 [Nitrosopumilaceae archaeon]|nr:hypothetical protein [Nitrosopumilaceae archaeon]NIP09561.1 hypothetical protein [Nitrosopumilaceae archaeon]NIS95609.1 hypothetical protein [Nitrosopumilaceae archaeon]
MIRNISILLSVLVLGVFLIPAYAQSSIADHVVINEVDINPPGDDSASPKEWVELYNPTQNDMDIGGWKIASTTVLKQTLTIPAGTIIESGDFITYSYKTVWFTDTNEVVELRDNNGVVVDSTALMTDIQNDFTSWQRIYDGYDLDSADDWKFETSTAGSTNGKIPVSDEVEDVSVTISSSKSSYIFGETAVLTGRVSEEVFVQQLGDFKPEPITVTITGPQFVSEILLYPDLNLNFGTSLSLHPVLGINEGVYDVSVTYADASSSTSFSVGEEIIELETPEAGTFAIVTDKSQYLPGETLILSGITSEEIPFEGLKYELKDPTGIIIESGTLYPTDGKFAGEIFLTTVNPIFGTYVITAEYLGQISTSFTLVEDVKEDVTISLWTDKDLYAPGDIVTITGRLNNLWISSMDLEILQTKNTALGVNEFAGGDFAFKTLDVVRLEGDSSFKYTFQIPKGEERLGDYRVKVSKEVGTAIKSFSVVEDPAEDIVIREPISIKTDKSTYSFGDSITISGFVNELSQSTTSVPVVEVSIKDKDGNPLTIIGGTGQGRLGSTGSTVSYDFTAVPDLSGRYSITTELSHSVFDEDQYLVTAKYLDISNSITFSVIDELASTSLSLNKEVYGLGETVYLTGILPPLGEPSVSISITKPDGSVINSGASTENQQFSWEWITPIAEKQQTVKGSDDRSVTISNLGIYKIQVSNDSLSRDLFFKVSLDPANDTLEILPINVFTDKPIYKAGETLKVLGSVITREQGDEGLVVPERVHLTVISALKPTIPIHQASVYPDQGGNFQSLFELPITIFSEGQYKVKAVYLKKQIDYSFGVANEFTFGTDEPITLLVSSDKSQYNPGDIVLVTGKPNKLIYLEEFNVSVFKKTGQEITCGSFICGTHEGPVTTIRPSPSGSFSYQFAVPDSFDSLGKYEVTVESDFEIKKIFFDVVAPSPKEPLTQTIIEKVNSIPEREVSVNAMEKEVDGVSVGPRVLMGSLVASPRGEEPNVNLRVTSESGVCVIGPEENCLVKDSTRKPGEIYDIVQVDGTSMKVRYSGPDARVEKFSILPESSTEMLPDSTWNIEVVKDSQASRLYYKINYSVLE